MADQNRFGEASQLLRHLYKFKQDGRLMVVALPSKANRKASEEARDAGTVMSGRLYRESRLLIDAKQADAGQLLTGFLEQNNGSRGLYFRQGLMGSNATTGQRSEVHDIGHVWVDIDTRNFVAWCKQAFPDSNLDPHDHATIALDNCAIPPTATIFSGGGIQAFWRFDTRMGEDQFRSVEQVNAQLARIFGGDDVHGVQSCMRLPGTLNVNYDPARRAELLGLEDERSVPFKDLVSWVVSEKTLFGPETDPAPANDADPSTPEGLSRRLIAVGAILSPMSKKITEEDVAGLKNDLKHPGRRNNSAARLVGKMVRDGKSVEEIMGVLTGESSLSTLECEQLVNRIVKKHERDPGNRHVPRTEAEKPEPEPEPESDEDEDDDPDEAAAPETQPETAAPVSPTLDKMFAAVDKLSTKQVIDGVEVVVDGDTAKTKKVKRKKGDDVGKLVDLVLVSLRQNEQDLLHNDKTWFIYNPLLGVWHDTSDDEIERVVTDLYIAALGTFPPTRTRNEILNSVRTRVHKEVVDWGDHLNIVVCSDGKTIDLDAAKLVPKDKSRMLRASRVVAAKWDPTALTPVWDAAIEDALAHFPNAERGDIKTLIEEHLGASLLRRKNKQISRCTILYGPRDTGKSTVLQCIRIVLGDALCSSSELYKAGDNMFALAPLVGKAAWTLDELPSDMQINEGVFKRVITNDPLDVNRKFMSTLTNVRLNLSCFFATNAMPRIDDPSDATYARITFIPFETKFASYGGHKTPNPNLEKDLLVERDGLLQMMVRSALRLKARGEFTLSPTLLRKQLEIRRTLDPITDFFETGMVMAGHASYVRIADIMDAYRGYMALSHDPVAAAKKTLDGRWFGRRISEAYPMSETGKVDRGFERARFGVHLTEAGKRWLQEGRILRSNGVVSPSSAELDKANGVVMVKVAGGKP